MKRTKHSDLVPPSEFHLWKQFSSTSFLVINKDLLRCYGAETAIMLSNLVDKFLYFAQRNMTEDNGWFYQTHEQQTNALGITEYSLKRIKAQLKKEGVLQTRMKGIPAKEWYKLNIANLWKIIESKLTVNGQDRTKDNGLDPTDSCGLNPTDSSGLYNDTISNENKDKDILLSDQKTIPTKGNGEIKNTEVDPFLQLARKLALIIRSKKQMKYTGAQIASWAVEIKRLHKQEVPIERIAAALGAYKKLIGGEYIPVIESGHSLREKFLRLEAAIEREKEKKPDQRPPGRTGYSGRFAGIEPNQVIE